MAYAAAIAVVALALIAYFGYRTLSAPSYTKVPTAKEIHSRAEQLTLKSGGDFSKLSPEEQKLLDGMTMGRGKRYVDIHYGRLAGSGGK